MTDQNLLTAAELLRSQAIYLDARADENTTSAEDHRHKAARCAAIADQQHDMANEHREAADRLDRLADGGVVVNVHVTATDQDVTQAVVDALQASANGRQQ